MLVAARCGAREWSASVMGPVEHSANRFTRCARRCEQDLAAACTVVSFVIGASSWAGPVWRLSTVAVRIEITLRFLDNPGQRAGFVLVGVVPALVSVRPDEYATDSQAEGSLMAWHIDGAR